ncbi:YqaJ viral recombinase family protein [Halorhodospira sp. 9622]|uniref:YqaJ viral recombinase family protein n=1 Tax=Halorhodospira sp. 9622 TaxID=2899136 RepID=UPI001EE8FDB8|nr:YqaJ viral recombinase family protein [Halorhodospira sp. 9622]MCG5538991.1 hypothetical protein [Halorhodospira sp. 9622]
MEVLDLVQGTPEWNRLRASHYNASEAPAVMGVGPIPRSDLLSHKASGTEQAFSDWAQKNLLDKGHADEEAARPIAEKIIGEELFRATVRSHIDGLPLLASCDGLTMLNDVVWEHKSWNQAKAEQVRAGQVPDEHVWQLEQQLMITGADRALFMLSDGTEDNCIWCWYEPDPEKQRLLVRAWHQFDEDLRAYQPREDGPEVTGSAPGELPALHIQITGGVTASNLNEFKSRALEVFQGIKTDLATDQDFADAAETAKWCKEIEKRLDAAKEHALSQTQSIDELFKAIDEIREQARKTRLDLDKKVEHRKKAIRQEIIAECQNALAESARGHEEELGLRIEPEADFAGAIKGKKTVKTVRDAAEQELADARLRLAEEAERLRANLSRFRDLTEDHPTLFPDWADLIRKPGDDMEAAIKARIAEHQERRRQEAEQERARQAERRQAEQEAQHEAAPPVHQEPDVSDTGETTEAGWDVPPETGAANALPTQWTVAVTLQAPAKMTRAAIERVVRDGASQAGQVVSVSADRAEQEAA